jgi:nucleoside-triphosphatase THEP1
LVFVTGPRGSGKSSRCAEFATYARACSVLTGGLLSIPVFDSGTKIAIELLDVSTGAVRRFAWRHGFGGADVGRWKLEDGALAWANAVLRDAARSTLLLVDELGPMELLRGGGLVEGVRALDEGAYGLALAVVRPELIPHALARWPHGKVLDVGGDRRPLITRLTEEAL